MASLHLGSASLINESWVVFGSSLKLRIGFRNKRFRRVAERRRFRAQHMSEKEHRTKHELARSAKRSESLRYILKQYGVSVENPEDNKTNGRLGDLNYEEKHDTVPFSVINDSKMKSQNTTEELPDLRREEKYIESVSSIAENLSGQNHRNFPRKLNTGVLFTYLLPVFGFCIICIIGLLHRIIFRKLKNSNGRKTSQGLHHGSKTTRWRTVLNDWTEPCASDEHDSSPEKRVSSANQEAAEVYRKVDSLGSFLYSNGRKRNRIKTDYLNTFLDIPQCPDYSRNIRSE